MAQVFDIALIGCGRIAKKHLQAIRYEESQGRARLVAVADSREEQARSLLRQVFHAHRAEDIPVFPALSELLLACSPDIVSISTPSGSHRELALEALAQGAHLLVEKPLAMTYRDALQVVEAAVNAKKKLALGHIYRYLPGMALLQEALREGRYGKVLYGSVVVRWGHDQAYYDASPWRGTRKYDGGVIMNQSIHALDLLRWLLQCENSELLKVQGIAKRQTHDMESEDLSFGIFQFANGTYLNYEGSTSTEVDKQEAGFFIACEQADIRAGLLGKRPHFSVRSKGREERWRYLSPHLRQLWRRTGWKGLKTLANPHSAIYTDLITAIREDRDPLAGPRSGLSSLEMVEALYLACGIEV